MSREQGQGRGRQDPRWGDRYIQGPQGQDAGQGQPRPTVPGYHDWPPVGQHPAPGQPPVGHGQAGPQGPYQAPLYPPYQQYPPPQQPFTQQQRYRPAQPPPRRKSLRERHLSRAGIFGWSIALLVPTVFFLTIFMLLVFVGRPYIVHGLSMYPTLHDGDRVFVVPYRGNTTPNRGDVVVLKNVDGIQEMLIKRVVALDGDTITVGDDSLVVNGKIKHKSTNHTPTEPYTQIVPEGHIYVMGDNEGLSFDSRSFGPVPKEDVVGKAMLIFWPPSDFTIF